MLKNLKGIYLPPIFNGNPTVETSFVKYALLKRKLKFSLSYSSVLNVPQNIPIPL